MTQLGLFAADEPRLARQERAVLDVMRDGGWRSLGEIRDAVGRISETGASAALRRLRAKGYQVASENLGCGLWRYRIGGGR